MYKLFNFFCLFFIFIINNQNLTGKKILHVVSKGKGRAIVTIHGGPGMSSAYFTPYLDRLSKNNKLVYYDQKGCGLSFASKNYKATFQKYINDLNRVIQKTGKKRAVILAHSFGVVLALKYIIKYPQKVHSLILVSGFARKHPEQYKYYRIPLKMKKKIRKIKNSNFKQSIKLKKINTLKFSLYFYKAKYKKRDFLNSLIYRTGFNKKIFQDLAYSSGFLNFDARNKLEKIKTPALIICGKHDIITPPFLSVEMSRFIQNSRLIIFTQSGHFPFIEETGKFLSIVNAFLSKN